MKTFDCSFKLQTSVPKLKCYAFIPYFYHFLTSVKASQCKNQLFDVMVIAFRGCFSIDYGVLTVRRYTCICLRNSCGICAVFWSCVFG